MLNIDNVGGSTIRKKCMFSIESSKLDLGLCRHVVNGRGLCFRAIPKYQVLPRRPLHRLQLQARSNRVLIVPVTLMAHTLL